MTNTCGLGRLPEPLRGTLGTALSRLHSLTGRERQILGQLVGSPQYGELARALGTSERTVKFHVTNLRTKLGGLTRLQLCLDAVLDLTHVQGCSRCGTLEGPTAVDRGTCGAHADDRNNRHDTG